MARTDTLANYITDISNAVREKTGKTDLIKANELDTEIASIEAGGSELPLIETINDAFSGVSQILNKVVENYQKILNIPVILYTPDTNFRCYCIYKRSSGKYGIAWLPNAYIGYSVNNFYVRYIKSNNITTQGMDGTASLINVSQFPYLSNEMDTIDDCISAIQSSETTYTQATGATIGYVKDVDYIIPVTNTVVFDTTYTTYDIRASRQISANETIEVIQANEI